jgi:hypothetical protein
MEVAPVAYCSNFWHPPTIDQISVKTSKIVEYIAPSEYFIQDKYP